MKKSLKYLSIVSAILFITGSIYIYTNRAEIFNAKICDTLGTTYTIKLPFESKDDKGGIRTIEFNFRNSIFFSGELQIIPNDCVDSLIINNTVVPEYLYDQDRCNYATGFYLDISNYLRKDQNSIKIVIRNSDSKYGINVIDTTRYELYIILLIILCICPLLVIKYLHFSLLLPFVKKFRKQILFSISLSGFCLGILYCTVCLHTRVELIKSYGSTELVSLPYYIDESNPNAQSTLYFKINIFNLFFLPKSIKVIPDDCIQFITINERDITSSLNQNKLCNNGQSIDIAIKRYLKLGKNEILIAVNNLGGPGGIDIIKNTQNNSLILIYIFLLMVLSPFLYHVCSKFRYGIIVAILFVVSIFIWLNYAFYVPYESFTHDIEGHLQYIKYIYEKSHIPNSSGGWSFYHPPLYYISAAVIWHIADFFGDFSKTDFYKILQIYSLLLFIIYSYFSIKTLDLIFNKYIEPQLIKGKKFLLSIAYLSSISIFLFWSSNIIHSIRIGNDILLYTTYAIAFYYIVKWNFSKSYKDLILSLTFTSLAIWTKNNSILLFGIVGLIFITQYILDKTKKINQTGYLLTLTIIGGFAIVSLFFSYNEKIKNIGNGKNMPLKNDYLLPDYLKVDNKLTNFLPINPEKFVAITYTDAGIKERGSHLFWFYLAKTSLFGEFEFNKPSTVVFAKIVSFMFLLLVPIALAGIIISFFNFKINAPFIINLIFLIISVILFRLISPYSCSTDFRYIFPAIVPFAYFEGLTGSFLLKRNMILFLITMLITVVFVLSSICFQVSYVTNILDI